MTFSLRGDSIPTDGSGLVNITDIGDTNGNALICRSGIPTTAGGEWYLHPTQMSTNDGDRIGSPPPDRGWSRYRAADSQGHRLVRLRRANATAVEGVFTCDITGDNNTPRALGVYYPSESWIMLQYNDTVSLVYIIMSSSCTDVH